MSIRDKLSRLDSTTDSHPQESVSESSWIEQVQQELDLRVIRQDKSFVLLKENYFPLIENREFNELREQGFLSSSLYELTGQDQQAIQLKNALYIDTETTGLAGGTGTYAFLIGVGHIELDTIVVRQYLLPDFHHEWLVLEHLNRLFETHEYTVSFNGKSFDLPLLRNRFILNRQILRVDDLLHLDILHAARRIWRDTLPACDLQSLERHVLGVNRHGDIPGEYIPQIYFEFIRKRDALLLRDVLEHNYHDIVNLVLLTFKLAGIAESPLTHLQDPRELFALARYHSKNKRYQRSNQLLEAILARIDVERRVLEDSLFLLSMNSKRCGRVETARECLTTLLERQVLHPLVVEELAKILEHTDKNYVTALSVVERGLSYLDTMQQLEVHQDFTRFFPTLRHRKDRLERKLTKENK